MANTKSKTKTLKLIKKAVKKRSPKVAKSQVSEVAIMETVGIPAFVEPTEYDLHDELARMDSFSYRQYNE